MLAALGSLPRTRLRCTAAAIAGVLALLVIFSLAGVPLRSVMHVRVWATADSIAQGIAALPRSLVPYNGPDEWVRVVNLLGAGLLLASAGLVLAFAPGQPGDLRRAGAALPLIALAVVPAAVARPQLPYVQGILLFALIAAFLWGERVRRDDLGRVLGACALAGAAGMIVAPALDAHKPWLNYNGLVTGLTSGQIETFNWSQSYGPLNWPRTGRQVLGVQARYPDYWKAADLDQFDGRSWVSSTVDNGNEPPAPDPAAVREWTQTLKVTFGSMTTSDLPAAGFAAQPVAAPGAVVPGASPGTWTVANELGPGDGYSVRVYDPQPTAAPLAAAGRDYDQQVLAPYLSLTMPQSHLYGVSAAAQQVTFAPFGSSASAQDTSDPVDFTGTSAVNSSPYAAAYALARQLASRSATPYAYVTAVMSYLARGFTYTESPPVRTFPLESFLFTDKAGYCQQFAGAMALLLRMGGIPARVAAGFTTGTYNQSSHEWVVTDVDAHAWVEAWFPRYGWVRFDPTPAAAPARGGRSPIASSAGTSGATPAPKPSPTPRAQTGSGAPASTVNHGAGSSDPLLIVAALLGSTGLVVLGAWFFRGSAQRSGEELLVELERALARSGRPVTGTTTLAVLEHRFRGSPRAAAYIRAIRLERYGSAGELPDNRQRRALRAELRSGLGFAGRVRALWALPPRPPSVAGRWPRHLHSN
jgi:transglutaminase-like putative cysteine protease